jgi:hypothetical protein
MERKRKMKKNKTPLEVLSEQSKNAINLVLTTIANLRDTNKTIETERQKNDEMIISIQNTNNSLDELKAGNEKIISNFEKLLQ